MEHIACDGVEALKILDSGVKVDAIVLDINMPNMNGIEFLRVLNKRGQKEQVLIVSTLARDGGKETIEALELGAFDFVTKPSSLAMAKGPTFARRIVSTLRIATGLTEERPTEASAPKTGSPMEAKETSIGVQSSFQMPRKSQLHKPERTFVGSLRGDVSLHSKKPLGQGARKIVALACSTGGPKALQSVIPKLPSNLDAAVILVQHMPEGFTASLAKRLDELSSVHVKEAEHGEILQKGVVYIAKGGSQMRLKEKSKQSHVLSVTVEEARNALKPCADIMYESLMDTTFDEITCVIMTGMGSDGTQGILQLEKTNKIYVIAQDQKSSIVYGMPKAIAEVNAVDEVVSLEQIAEAITKHVGVQ